MSVWKSWKICLAVFMSLLISHIPHVAAAEVSANMVSTMEFVDEVERGELEKKVNARLASEEVQQQLLKMGVEPEEISARIASLSNQELTQMAQQMDQAQYGGDALGIVLLVFLILGIIYLAKRI